MDARWTLVGIAVGLLGCGPGAARDDGGSDATVDAARDPVVFTSTADPAERTDCAPRPSAGIARAQHVTCASQLVAGSLAMGRTGDIVMENARVRFVIRAGDESASTIGGFAGGVIDAAAGDGVDQLKEIFTLFDFATGRPSEILVTDAGDDAEARVTVLFEGAPLGLVDAVAPGFSRALPIRGAIDYVLGGDSDALTIRISVSPAPGAAGLAVRPGLLALLGGNGEIERPGIGPLVQGATSDSPVLVSEGAREAIAVALGSEGASLLFVNTIHLLGSSDRVTLTPGETTVFSARVGVGATAADAWRAAIDPGSTVDLTGTAGDRVELALAAGGAYFRTRFGADGSARVPVVAGPVVAGDYLARGGFGGFFPGAETTVSTTAPTVVPSAPRATLTIDATVDGVGAPVRVRVRDSANLEEDLLRFVAIGVTTRELPAGDYLVSISHGMEHDVHEETVVLAAGDARTIAVPIDRAIDTTGWVSTDFHLHSDLSTDSLHHVEDALRIIAAEGLDLVASTDHDYLTDYGAVAMRAGVADQLVVVTGVEVSSTVIGHIGGYPLVPNASHAGAGAPLWFDRSPREIFDAIRERGDATLGGAIVQINHPRLRGTGYFDQVGLDRATGHATADPMSLDLPATTDLDDFAFDVIEVWNGYTRGDNEASFEDFLALAVAGRRFTMIGNSDSHRAELPAGAPRSFVRVPDDARGAFTWEDVAVGLRSGDVTVAAGIFVTAEATGPRAAGSVPIHVRVQAAPWVDVTRLRVYAGRDVVVDRALTGASSVRLDETIDVPIGAAPFVVVRADGDADAEPVFGFRPFGVTNPLDVP